VEPSTATSGERVDLSHTRHGAANVCADLDDQRRDDSSRHGSLLLLLHYPLEVLYPQVELACGERVLPEQKLLHCLADSGGDLERDLQVVIP
jgi:hypothetical protein